jgi:hypothetical protein
MFFLLDLVLLLPGKQWEGGKTLEGDVLVDNVIELGQFEFMQFLGILINFVDPLHNVDFQRSLDLSLLAPVVEIGNEFFEALLIEIMAMFVEVEPFLVHLLLGLVLHLQELDDVLHNVVRQVVLVVVEVLLFFLLEERCTAINLLPQLVLDLLLLLVLLRLLDIYLLETLLVLFLTALQLVRFMHQS